MTPVLNLSVPIFFSLSGLKQDAEGYRPEAILPTACFAHSNLCAQLTQVIAAVLATFWRKNRRVNGFLSIRPTAHFCKSVRI